MKKTVEHPTMLLYKAWQLNPYATDSRSLLEAEFAKTMEIPWPPNANLAQVIIAQSEDTPELLNHLKKIAQQINAFNATQQPDYLTVLLMEIMNQSNILSEEVIFNDKDTDPELSLLQTAYININSDNAVKGVLKNPQLFFALDVALQHDVQAKLYAAKTKAADAAFAAIKLETEQRIHLHQINSINPNIRKGDSQINDYLGLQTAQKNFEFLSKKAQVEARYQQILIATAIKKATETHQPLRFDPQGHFIIDVTLTHRDYQDLENSFPNIDIYNLLDVKNSQAAVLCNIDVRGIHHLEMAYLDWIIANNINQTTFNQLMSSASRSSIIPLQEEMEMHMRLLSRVLEEKIAAEKGWDWHKIRETAALQINTIVAEQFRVALLKSTEGNIINIATLNQNLDQARGVVAPKCHTFLIESCRNLYGDDFDAAYEARQDTILGEDFEKKSATGQDYLRTDFTNQSATRISGTPYTAHDKKTGIAIRSLHRTVYDLQNGQPTIKPLSKVSVEARVPSIALKSASHSEAVQGVKKTLAENYTLLQKQLGHDDGPMVYNLLTSLHSRFYDNVVDRKNRQRASAARIIKGAHDFNSQQVRDGKPNSLWYVQNIAVNQHTNNLNYDSWDNATAEATLMSEMAMLSTFNQNAALLSPPLRSLIQNAYREAHQAYVAFLKAHTQGDKYFKDSEEGKQVIKNLIHFKEILQAVAGLEKGKTLVLPETKAISHFSVKEDAPLTELAIKALIKMLALNKHWDKQYGMLVQSLSVFVEKASQAGCKSANERYINLSGRVHLLHIINETGNALEGAQSVKEALRDFVNSPTTSPAVLQKALDTAYNRHNLYGAATVISEEDQGAASKVKKTKEAGSGVVKEKDTNVAETGYMSFLFQEFPKKMQPHNTNLAKKLHATFKIGKGIKSR